MTKKGASKWLNEKYENQLKSAQNEFQIPIKKADFNKMFNDLYDVAGHEAHIKTSSSWYSSLKEEDQKKFNSG